MKTIGIACIGAGHSFGLDMLHIPAPRLIHYEPLLRDHSVDAILLVHNAPMTSEEVARIVMACAPKLQIVIVDLSTSPREYFPSINDMLLNETFVMTISDLSMDDYKLNLTEKEFNYSLYEERKDRFKYSKRNVKINVGNRTKKAFFQRKVIS